MKTESFSLNRILTVWYVCGSAYIVSFHYVHMVCLHSSYVVSFHYVHMVCLR